MYVCMCERERDRDRLRFNKNWGKFHLHLRKQTVCSMVAPISLLNQTKPAHLHLTLICPNCVLGSMGVRLGNEDGSAEFDLGKVE